MSGEPVASAQLTIWCERSAKNAKWVQSREPKPKRNESDYLKSDTSYTEPMPMLMRNANDIPCTGVFEANKVLDSRVLFDSLFDKRGGS